MALKDFISEFHREESGQDMPEYAIVLAAVLAAVVAGMHSLSRAVATKLMKIDKEIRHEIRKAL
jgi:Flp pilus assembly pilin Flp